jgi:type II secretory pathway pseudopilin PulG
MSTILVNTLTGTSTAGSIAVTGEGNSTTTNLQQGLAKAWLKFDPADSNAIRDSLNFASITDNGAGEHTLVFSSSMANAEYCVHVTGSTNRTGSVDTDSQTTAQYGSQTDADDSGNRADTNHTFSSAHGDLA